MTSPQKKQLVILTLLFVVFASPALLSWYLFHYTDLGKNPSTQQHGTLIQPPRPLPNWSLTNPFENGGEDKPLHGKWSLVYLLDGDCRQECEQNLYRMRQLRLATGKYAHRVQRIVVVLNNDRRAISQGQLQGYSGQLALYPADAGAALSPFKLDELPSTGRLYLVDPLGNLMMSYAGDAEPNGIIKDLKRLLKYARAG